MGMRAPGGPRSCHISCLLVGGNRELDLKSTWHTSGKTPDEFSRSSSLPDGSICNQAAGVYADDSKGPLSPRGCRRPQPRVCTTTLGLEMWGEWIPHAWASYPTTECRAGYIMFLYSISPRYYWIGDEFDAIRLTCLK